MERFLLKNSVLIQELAEYEEKISLREIAHSNGLKKKRLIELIELLIRLDKDSPSIYNYAFNGTDQLFKSLAGVPKSTLGELQEIANYLILPLSLREKIKIQLGLPETLTGLLPSPYIAINFKAPAFWIWVGSLEGLKKTKLSKRTSKYCLIAAIKGSIDILEYLHNSGCPWNAETSTAAVCYSKFELLKWAHEHGCPWDTSTSRIAAKLKDPTILKWLIQNGCPTNTKVSKELAIRGDLETLKWIRECGVPWSPSTCESAIEYGHFEFLKWSHEHGCPWDYRTTKMAASKNNLEILEWALKFGCPCDKSAGSEAASKGHIEALKILQKYDQLKESSDHLTFSAAAGNQLETLKWLRETGCPWHNQLTAILSQCQWFDSQRISCLKWAIENGCPCTEKVCENLDGKLLQWAKDYGLPHIKSSFDTGQIPFFKVVYRKKS